MFGQLVAVRWLVSVGKWHSVFENGVPMRSDWTSHIFTVNGL